MLKIEDYAKWLQSCEAIGIPAITTDTCAKILAVTLELGNNEFMVLNQKFQLDIKYICRRFYIEGGESPKPEIIEPLKHYVNLLKEAKSLPEWAEKVFRERYGMKLYF